MLPAAALCCLRGHQKCEKGLLALSLAKLRYNTEAILKTYELFIYGDTHYITNPFCKNALKIVTL
jgi:hypothetical protein